MLFKVLGKWGLNGEKQPQAAGGQAVSEVIGGEAM